MDYHRFWKFSDVIITQDECRQLQRNLIVTHAVGAGDPFPGMWPGHHAPAGQQPGQGLFRHRLELVETLVAMLNRGVTPVIPRRAPWAPATWPPVPHGVPMLGLGQADMKERSCQGT